MVKYPFIVKGFSIGIILLFIGIAFAPSVNFNIAKASIDDDFVEVTSEAYGIKDFGTTTVKLTRQQYRNLEQYLVDFRERLNQTTTREEAISNFNEAVMELNKYDLLPKGMSVEQAQKLVMGDYSNKKYINLKNSALNQMENRTEMLNILCFVAGQITSDTWFDSLSLIGIVLVLLFGIIMNVNPSLFFYVLFTFLYSMLLLNPIALFNVISFGGSMEDETTPGWIQTIGLLGVKKIEGEMKGAIIGFTGLQIYVLSTGKRNFLGASLVTSLYQ